MLRRDIIKGMALAAAGSMVMTAKASEHESAQQQPPKKAEAEGAVVLVTGSNRGIGLGFVRVLLERGAKKVYATARNPNTFDNLVALDPKRVVPIELDVNNDAQRRAAAEQATDVTWLINNAAYPGSATAGERRIRSAETLDDCKHVMETNCWSPAELARLFIPTIIQNGGGAIINILSVGAWFSLPEYASYTISKAAAANMTGGLRIELDRDPILVSSVFTGGVDTRAAPAGSRSGGGVSPEEHAHEVIDALARGETNIYAAGARGMRSRIDADPVAFERSQIDRFYTNPLVIRRHL